MTTYGSACQPQGCCGRNGLLLHANSQAETWPSGAQSTVKGESATANRGGGYTVYVLYSIVLPDDLHLEDEYDFRLMISFLSTALGRLAWPKWLAT